MYIVLIETYWNVNKSSRGRGGRTCGSLNRNILECKFDRPCCIMRPSSGLNRNILECKCGLRGCELFGRAGLNRNILECKFNLPAVVCVFEEKS